MFVLPMKWERSFWHKAAKWLHTLVSATYKTARPDTTLRQQQVRNDELCGSHVSEGRKEEMTRGIKKLESQGHGDTIASFVFIYFFF